MPDLRRVAGPPTAFRASGTAKRNSSVRCRMHFPDSERPKFESSRSLAAVQTLARKLPMAIRLPLFNPYLEKELLMKVLPGAVKVAIVAGVLVFGAPTAVLAQSGPFTGFAGSWTGGGTVSLSDGSTERIRCRASYRVDDAGSSVKQTLRCANDSYKFDISSDVTSQSGNVLGTWNESSRKIYGNLQGRAAVGQLAASVEAAGFTANLHMITRGNRQSVSISSPGEIRGVSVNLVRG
jgi:hypothetical protein